MAQDQGSKPWSQIFLGAVGSLLLAAIFIFGNRLAWEIDGALIIVGAAFVVLAGFWSRVEGRVGITREGLTIPIEAVNRAEHQLDQGKVVEADKLPELLREIRDALSEARDHPDPAPSPEAEDDQQ